MKDVFYIFLELIYIAIGRRECFSSTPSDTEWRILFELSQKQSLVGLCRDALDKLPEPQWPPQDVILKWSAASHRIEIRNHEVNKATVKVTERFRRKGFQTCILKGQGNALLYYNPLARTSGDIDIWLSGGCRRIIRFAREMGIAGKTCYHHIEWKPYKDVDIEVHYRPSFMFNPFHNHRLQEWFKQYADVQFANMVALPDMDGQIAVPTFKFNVVYQLSHLANHFFHEGIGLRQFADYYFLLMQNQETVSDNEYVRVLKTDLKNMGLHDFAKAVMWVLGEVFMMERKYMIVNPDDKRGKFLLEEIMEGGNFGKYDNRILSGVQSNSLKHNLARVYREIRLFRLFPSETFWEPVFRVYHFVWRIQKLWCM